MDQSRGQQHQWRQLDKRWQSTEGMVGMKTPLMTDGSAQDAMSLSSLSSFNPSSSHAAAGAQGSRKQDERVLAINSQNRSHDRYPLHSHFSISLPTAITNVSNTRVSQVDAFASMNIVDNRRGIGYAEATIISSPQEVFIKIDRKVRNRQTGAVTNFVATPSTPIPLLPELRGIIGAASVPLAPAVEDDAMIMSLIEQINFSDAPSWFWGVYGGGQPPSYWNQRMFENLKRPLTSDGLESVYGVYYLEPHVWPVRWPHGLVVLIFAEPHGLNVLQQFSAKPFMLRGTSFGVDLAIDNSVTFADHAGGQIPVFEVPIRYGPLSVALKIRGPIDGKMPMEIAQACANGCNISTNPYVPSEWATLLKKLVSNDRYLTSVGFNRDTSTGDFSIVYDWQRSVGETETTFIKQAEVFIGDTIADATLLDVPGIKFTRETALEHISRPMRIPKEEASERNISIEEYGMSRFLVKQRDSSTIWVQPGDYSHATLVSHLNKRLRGLYLPSKGGFKIGFPHRPGGDVFVDSGTFDGPTLAACLEQKLNASFGFAHFTVSFHRNDALSQGAHFSVSCTHKNSISALCFSMSPLDEDTSVCFGFPMVTGDEVDFAPEHSSSMRICGGHNKGGMDPRMTLAKASIPSTGKTRIDIQLFPPIVANIIAPPTIVPLPRAEPWALPAPSQNPMTFSAPEYRATIDALAPQYSKTYNHLSIVHGLMRTTIGMTAGAHAYPPTPVPTINTATIADFASAQFVYSQYLNAFAAFSSMMSDAYAETFAFTFQWFAATHKAILLPLPLPAPPSPPPNPMLFPAYQVEFQNYLNTTFPTVNPHYLARWQQFEAAYSPILATFPLPRPTFDANSPAHMSMDPMVYVQNVLTAYGAYVTQYQPFMVALFAFLKDGHSIDAVPTETRVPPTEPNDPMSPTYMQDVLAYYSVHLPTYMAFVLYDLTILNGLVASRFGEQWGLDVGVSDFSQRWETIAAVMRHVVIVDCYKDESLAEKRWMVLKPRTPVWVLDASGVMRGAFVLRMQPGHEHPRMILMGTDFSTLSFPVRVSVAVSPLADVHLIHSQEVRSHVGNESPLPYPIPAHVSNPFAYPAEQSSIVYYPDMERDIRGSRLSLGHLLGFEVPRVYSAVSRVVSSVVPKLTKMPYFLLEIRFNNIASQQSLSIRATADSKVSAFQGFTIKVPLLTPSMFSNFSYRSPSLALDKVTDMTVTVRNPDGTLCDMNGVPFSFVVTMT